MNNRKSKKTLSPRQLAANRANAAKSTGPRTPEGKAVSSRNAVICLPNPLLLQEDKEEFLALSAALRAEFTPRSNTEELLYEEIVEIKWQQIRCRQMEKENLNMAATEPDVLDNFQHIEGLALSTQAHKYLSDNSRTLHLLNRQLSRLNREFHKTMDLYLRIHGPLNSPACSPSEPVPVPSPEPPKQIEPVPENEHRPAALADRISRWARAPKPASQHPADPISPVVQPDLSVSPINPHESGAMNIRIAA